MDEIHTFAPTFISDFRFGFNRYDAFYYQAIKDRGQGFRERPLQSDATGVSGVHGHERNRVADACNSPLATATRATGITAGTTRTNPITFISSLTRYTKVAGAHTLKFGGEVRLQDFTNINWADSTGLFTFDTGTWVKANSNASAPTLGGSMAEFLLGLPTSGSYAVNSPSKGDAYYSALFLQDDCHVAAESDAQSRSALGKRSRLQPRATIAR